MEHNIKFYKMKFLIEFNKACDFHRQKLLDELIDEGTDPVVVKRRMRMIANLSEYQSQIITKLMNFDTDDINDIKVPLWKTFGTHPHPHPRPELMRVIDRSA